MQVIEKVTFDKVSDAKNFSELGKKKKKKSSVTSFLDFSRNP